MISFSPKLQLMLIISKHCFRKIKILVMLDGFHIKTSGDYFLEQSMLKRMSKQMKYLNQFSGMSVKVLFCPKPKLFFIIII